MRKIQKTADFKAFTALCERVLGLGFPIDYQVNVRKMRGHPSDWCGSYIAGNIRETAEGWVYRHKIGLALAPAMEARGILETLAHELVHAYCEENHPKASVHGRTFQRKAAALRRTLRGFGYKLAPLYLKGVDE